MLEGNRLSLAATKALRQVLITKLKQQWPPPLGKRQAVVSAEPAAGASCFPLMAGAGTESQQPLAKQLVPVWATWCDRRNSEGRTTKQKQQKRLVDTGVARVPPSCNSHMHENIYPHIQIEVSKYKCTVGHHAKYQRPPPSCGIKGDTRHYGSGLLYACRAATIWAPPAGRNCKIYTGKARYISLSETGVFHSSFLLHNCRSHRNNDRGGYTTPTMSDAHALRSGTPRCLVDMEAVRFT